MGNCNFIEGDLTKEKSVLKIIKTIRKKFKSLDVLICNQGNSEFKNNNLNFKFAFDNNFFSSISLINNSRQILKK